MKHNYYGKYKNILLRPLAEEDIENLRIWRNDKISTRFLRPVGSITPEMQKSWFDEYLYDEDIYTFAIIETNKLNRIVGSLAIYNFRSNKAEFGKIQIGDKEAHGLGIGKIGTMIVLKIAFELFQLETIDASVHQENIAAYKTYNRVGFQTVGSKESIVGGVEDIIEINYKRLKEVNENINEIDVGMLQNDFYF